MLEACPERATSIQQHPQTKDYAIIEYRHRLSGHLDEFGKHQDLK